MPQLKALLWDMDGTLCDTDVVHFDIFADLMKPFGHTVDEKFYKERISGKHNNVIFRELLPAHYTDEEIFEFGNNKEAISQYLASKKALVEPIRGLKKLLSEANQKNVPLVCVTNACRANAEFMLKHLGIDSHFQGVVIGEECEKPKPFPHPYLAALKLLNITADECLVFEDSPSGVKSAVDAKIKVIGVATSQTHEFLKSAGATIVVDHFDDLSIESLVQLVK